MKIIREKSGFSLAETMILLAIIGVMTTIAIPNIVEWLPAKRVNGAIRNLAADMHWARMKAVADNNRYVICFDIGNDTYSIYNNLVTCNPPPPNPIKQVIIPDYYPGINLTMSTFGILPGLIFQPRGTASNGSVELETQDGDRCKRITIITTARVRISDCPT